MTLQDEIRRRRELGLPAMTPEDQRAFQQNLTDTAAGDAHLAQVGSIKTTMKGAKIVDGPYKGMTPAAARQAAITGAAPPTGKSGYVRGGELSPRAGQLSAPSRPTVPRIAAPTPSAAPAAAPSAAPAPAKAAPSPQGAQSAAGAPPPALQAPPVFAGGFAPLATVGMALMNAAKPPVVASAAPRPQGMINGQPSGQFFQEAANKQGIPNNYGTVKPQSVSPPSPAPRPVDPAHIAQGGMPPSAPSAATTAADGWNRPGWPKTTPPGQPGYVPPGSAPAMAPPPASSPRIAPPMAAARSAAPSMVSSPTSGMPQNLRVPSKNALGNEALNPYTQVANTMKGAIAPFMKAPAPTGAAPPIPNRAVDPALADPRGFAAPDAAAPGNWEYRPMEQRAADNIRTIAGRGDDGFSRGLQVVNPFTIFQTLKQGGTSALPPMMGAQPTYANANDRLKGDTAAIKAARDSGFMKTQKTTDKFGEPLTQIATPFVRGTNQPAMPKPPGGTARPASALKTPIVALK